MTRAEVVTSSFQRARSPEQKALRRDTILAAARRCAAERGVRNVTLGDIAGSVGLTKSNVLRYFETREEIYLRLTADGYRDWAAWVAEHLPGSGLTPAGLAATLTDGLAHDPLFCDLISAAPYTLEHNVSAAAVLTFKRALLAAVDDLTVTLAGCGLGLTSTQARDLVLATTVLASGLWPWCNPPAVLTEVLDTHPELEPARLRFVPTMTATVEAQIRGLLHSKPQLSARE